MKKYLFPAFAAMMLAACSEDIDYGTPDGAPLSEYEPISLSSTSGVNVLTRAMIDKWDGTQCGGLYVVEDDANSNWLDTTNVSLFPFTENVPCIIKNAPIKIGTTGSTNALSDITFVTNPDDLSGSLTYYYPRSTTGYKNYMFWGYYPYAIDDSVHIATKDDSLAIVVKGSFDGTQDIMAYSTPAARLEEENVEGWNAKYIRALRAKSTDNTYEFPTLAFSHLTSKLKYSFTNDDLYNFANCGIACAFITVPKNYTLTLGRTQKGETIRMKKLEFSQEVDSIYLLGEKIPYYDESTSYHTGDVVFYNAQNPEDTTHPTAYVFTADHNGAWEPAIMKYYAKYVTPDYQMNDDDNARVTEIKAVKGDYDPEIAEADSILFAPTAGVYSDPNSPDTSKKFYLWIAQYGHELTAYEIKAPDGEFVNNHVYNIEVKITGPTAIVAKASLVPWNPEENCTPIETAIPDL